MLVVAALVGGVIAFGGGGWHHPTSIASNGSSSPRGGATPQGSHGTSGVIPWVGKVATSADLTARLPRPLKSAPPSRNAPACTASDLQLLPIAPLQWSQNVGALIQFRNVGSSSCLVRGTVGAVATAPGEANVVATGMSLPTANGEVANTPPNSVVSVALSVPISCSTDQGGNTQGLPVYHRVQLTVPGAGTKTITSLDFPVPCGIQVSPFFMPRPATRYATDWLKYVTPTLSLPSTVTRGSTLNYTVTLTNRLARHISLKPCPVYMEHTSTDIKLEYVLNCSSLDSLPAHGALTFQMKMTIPDSTPMGPMTLYWGLFGPLTSTRATVTVR